MVGSCHTTEMTIATRAEPATKSCVDVLAGVRGGRASAAMGRAMV